MELRSWKGPAEPRKPQTADLGERPAKRLRWQEPATGGPAAGQALADDEGPAKRKGFRTHSDASDFLKACFRDYSRQSSAGHVVLVKGLGPGSMSLAAVAARLAGAFLSDAHAFKTARQNGPAGLQFQQSLTKCERIVAVSDAMEARLPGLRELLDVAASVPGSRLSLVSSEALKKLERQHKQKKGQQSKPWTKMREILEDTEFSKVKSKASKCVTNFHTLLDFLSVVDRDATCPGF